MATEKITLARVSHFSKDKDGNPLMSKNGKPYTRCLIDATDGRKLSGFGNQTTSNWNEGMEVDVEVSTVEKNGNTYHNFNVPKTNQSGVSEMAIKTYIDQKLAPITEALRLIVQHLEIDPPKSTIGETGVEYPESSTSNGDGTSSVEAPW